MDTTFFTLPDEWRQLADTVTEEQSPKGLSVRLSGGKAVIAYSRRCEYFRGLGVLKQWQSEGRTEGLLEEKAAFSHLTYMADCSRNAVCSVAFLKKLLFWMALMGYDRLMLYTEDTYEITDRPFFGWMRGRFKQEEIRELDAYARELGIELVPCIQTLAHLNAIFRWKDFSDVHDTADILCCEEEKTYALVEDMIRTWAETVRSRVINIGMDEAEMIGRGGFLNKFGYQERFSIMQKHLSRVLSICKKYGFTCMMWSDMFFKLIAGGGYYERDIVIDDEIRAKIPSGVELVYWDYYSRDEKMYEDMIVNHKKLSETVGFAGGAWKWNGFAPLLNHSMTVSRMALESCKRHGIQNVIVTGWSDDGGEASQACVLPVLSLYAESCYGKPTDDEQLSARLLACTGAVLGDFLYLDSPNLTPDNPLPGRVSVGPAKYLLYQDALLGIYDRHVDKNTYPVHYAECAARLQKIAEGGGAFSYLFETLAALCSALEYKCDLGVRIKEAYDTGSRQELENLAQRALLTACRVDLFREALKKQWYMENKTFGWEVQDIRLAGVKERLHSAAQRLTDYVQGRVSVLEELEEERLVLDGRDNSPYDTLPLGDNNWKQMATACVI